MAADTTAAAADTTSEAAVRMAATKDQRMAEGKDGEKDEQRWLALAVHGRETGAGYSAEAEDSADRIFIGFAAAA